jgi:transposase
VLFFDEGRFGLKPTLGRCWARRGKTPYIPVKPGYTNFYLYSAVDPVKGEPFTLLLPWVNTDIMNLYLTELSRTYQDQGLLLIMDRAGWHTADRLEVPRNVHIEYLPAYSPELNPVERLWRWLRRHVCRNRLFESEKHLADSLCSTLTTLSHTFLTALCACNYMSNVN